jgi:hypothetical protein
MRKLPSAHFYELSDCSIVCFFHFWREQTSGQFVSLPMITNALTAFSTLVATNIGTRAIPQVYSNVRTILPLDHLSKPSLTS